MQTVRGGMVVTISIWRKINTRHRNKILSTLWRARTRQEGELAWDRDRMRRTFICSMRSGQTQLVSCRPAKCTDPFALRRFFSAATILLLRNGVAAKRTQFHYRPPHAPGNGNKTTAAGITPALRKSERARGPRGSRPGGCAGRSAERWRSGRISGFRGPRQIAHRPDELVEALLRFGFRRLDQHRARTTSGK